MITVLYLTDNRIDQQIMALCQRHLLAAAGDNPIVSVSQQPIDLGRNICVGEIGSSWLNLYRQQLAGLEVVDTEFVAIAEHDVIYSVDHFGWQPPDANTFWYNANCWFVQWPGTGPSEEYWGMYSYWPGRVALSQLIAPRDLLMRSIEERLHLIESGIRAMGKLGEPGAFVPEAVRLARKATNGSADYLKKYFENHISTFGSDRFKTKTPNLDIRHGTNFSGPRRGKKRRYELPPWGRFEDVLNG